MGSTKLFTKDWQIKRQWKANRKQKLNTIDYLKQEGYKKRIIDTSLLAQRTADIEMCSCTNKNYAKTQISLEHNNEDFASDCCNNYNNTHGRGNSHNFEGTININNGAIVLKNEELSVLDNNHVFSASLSSSEYRLNDRSTDIEVRSYKFDSDSKSVLYCFDKYSSKSGAIGLCNRQNSFFTGCGIRRALAVLVMVLSLLSPVYSSPISAKSSKRAIYVDDKMQNYLMSFGYLPESGLETGNLRTDDQLREAIKTLQAYGNIPTTGEVDEATKELLQKPRCGIRDLEYEEERNPTRRKRYVLQGRTWDHTNITWSLSGRRRPAALDEGRVRAELSRALAVWAQHSKLTFKEINSDQADIVVSFAKGYHDDGYPFDGRGQILAHAFFPGSDRGGDAHFDDDELWLLGDISDDEDGTSLFAVAAHEFGHSLGLSHSSVQGALMYPWYQGMKSNFDLPDDDKHGVQQMYGAKTDRQWADIPRHLQPSTTTTTTTTTTQRTQIHPERPQWPSYNPDKYPTVRYPGEKPEEPPNRQPERNPINPYHPRRRIHSTTVQPHEHPNRRTHNNPSIYYPNNKPDYPDRAPTQRPQMPNPRYPNYPHKNNPYPPYNKPENPRKVHVTKKPYIPERRPTYVPPRDDSKPVKPDTCDTSYDAVALIRGEVFIFKNAYLWRIGDTGLVPGYPAQIIRMWPGLPADLTHVDAVYERPDKKIVFFIGKQFYVYDSNRLERGYPRPLTDMSLPESLDKIDAAMVWGHNGKTYLYSGTMYWKYDEDAHQVELDYPRDMSMWKGVGYNIDSVFQWKDGKTYFFKGKGFWKFNDLHMRVERERQMLSAPFWMGCPKQNDEDNGNKQPYKDLAPAPTGTFDFSRGTSHWSSGALLLLITITYFILGINTT